MLQQTQVDRVLPAFKRFVLRFPDFAALAASAPREVIAEWRGLGYNSRAVRLRELARAVCERHGGALPDDETALLALPGIGPYTARAVLAFAFRRDAIAVDTNVRRIVARTQLGRANADGIAVAALDAVAGALVPRGRGFDFNSALMDLGATVCSARSPNCLVCPLRTLCAAAPLMPEVAWPARTGKRPTQPPFEETMRFLRGRIVDHLRSLPPHKSISLLVLYRVLKPVLSAHGLSDVRVATAALARDGLLVAERERVRLPG